MYVRIYGRMPNKSAKTISIGQINGYFIVKSTNDSPRIVTFDGFDNKLRFSS